MKKMVGNITIITLSKWFVIHFKTLKHLVFIRLVHGHFLSLRSLNNVPLSMHFVIMLQTKRKANSNMASTMKKRHISIQYTRALTSVFGFGYLDDASLRVLTVKIKWSNSSVEFSYWWSDWTMRQETICPEIDSNLWKFFLIFVWALSQQKQQRYLLFVEFGQKQDKIKTNDKSSTNVLSIVMFLYKICQIAFFCSFLGTKSKQKRIVICIRV